MPQDVSDEDALTGAWQRRITPAKTAEELDMGRTWQLRHQFAGKIWETNKLELEVTYYQKRLFELKQSILYDAEHLDKEIIDYGIHIAVDSDHIKNAPELVDRRVKEAALMREVEGKSESQVETTTTAVST